MGTNYYFRVKDKRIDKACERLAKECRFMGESHTAKSIKDRLFPDVLLVGFLAYRAYKQEKREDHENNST